MIASLHKMPQGGRVILHYFTENQKGRTSIISLLSSLMCCMTVVYLFIFSQFIFKPIPCGWSGIFGCFQSCHYKQCYNGYLCIYLVSQMWTTFVGYILKHMEMLDCHLFQFLKILANGPYIGVNEFTLPQAMHVLQSPPPASQFSSNNCNPLLMPIMMLDAVLNGLHTLSHLILTKP